MEDDGEDSDGVTPPEITDTKPKKSVYSKNNEKGVRFSYRDIGIAKKQLEMAKDMEELKIRFATLGEIRKNPEIIAKKDEMKAKLAESDGETVTADRGGEDE